MRQSLQNKFNLLAFLLIAFVLLMLPMFEQVRADTKESVHEASKTVLYRVTHDMQSKFRPKNLENTEVEDYWADQAKQADPNCGDACNPNADRDGDGMSNADEIKAGRNPSCNEEKYGTTYCQNADKYNLTTPQNITKSAPIVFLANYTFKYSSDCTGTQIPVTGSGCKTFRFPVNESFRQVVAYLNVSQYQGTSWTFRLGADVGGTNGTFRWTGTTSDNTPTTAPKNYNKPTAVGTVNNAVTGGYSATLSVGTTVPTPSGNWELKVYGIR